MKIAWSANDYQKLMAEADRGDITFDQLNQRFINLYQANFDDDLKSVMTMFYEDRDIAEDEALNRKAMRAEIVRRFIINEKEGSHSLADSLDWFETQIIVTTRKAFELAYKDKTVIQLFADGTDSELDAMDIEEEYFPDKSKSWPNIETIFLVEKP